MDRTPLQKKAMATVAGLLITGWLLLVDLRFWEFDIDYSKFALNFGFIWLWFYSVVPLASKWRWKRPPNAPS